MSVIKAQKILGPVGDKTFSLETSPRKVSLDLSSFYNDEAARDLLDLTVSELVHSHSPLLKSMYDFDVDTDDGIFKLLELLPILDIEIVKQITQELWPGYPVNEPTFNQAVIRAELRGYLLDILSDKIEEANETLALMETHQ